MIVGVNGRFLTKPFTGIGQYTRHLFSELALQNPNDTFVLVTPEKVEEQFPKNVTVSVLPERFFGTAGMKKTYWEQVQLPRFFKKRKADILHFPYPSNPWIRASCPVAVTVHDTIPWTMPEYRRSFLTRLYQNRAKKAIRKADAVVTVSQASKHDIIEACGIDSDAVYVIHNAPSPSFQTPFPKDKRAEVLKKYDINPERPFFLYIGGYDARKNVRTIIDTFQKEIAPKFEVDLVLAGGKSLDDRLYESFEYLTKKIKDPILRVPKGNIVVTGFVKEADLSALYQSSFAFLTLSSIEGFNLPLVEAAVSRTIVIASDIPVHREVLGDSALFCPLDASAELGNLMEKLLSDPTFYEKQKQIIKQYTCPFSWQQSAQKIMSLYKQLT